MKPEATTPGTILPFRAWKLRLKADCELQGRVFAFIALGDSILQMLWERGLDPTVRAVVEGDAEPGAKGDSEMPQSNGKPRLWKEIAMDVVGERDPQRFQQLIVELSDALETQLGEKLTTRSAVDALGVHPSSEEWIGYEKIVDSAVDLMGSDYASLQMLFPERGIGGELRLLAFRGFNPQAARFWEWVRADSQSTCGIALRDCKRVVASDIVACDFMAGSEDQEIYLQTGIHACQTTPLIGRAGNIVGMISTHWRKPHQPSEQDFRRFDILAWQAADMIESCRQEERLQDRRQA